MREPSVMRCSRTAGLHRPEGLYQSVFGLDDTGVPEAGVAADLMNRLMQEAKARGKKG